MDIVVEILWWIVRGFGLGVGWAIADALLGAPAWIRARRGAQ